MKPPPFDYIIVGGGSAGCVLASRLSEDPMVSVALIEAGVSDASNWVTIPVALIGTVPTKRMNWAYETVPQAGLNGRRGYQPRGKVMGGSSSINAMCYIRGHASDYDEWQANGCKGWGWDDVLPYFKKSEGNLDIANSNLHSTNGPLKVSNLRSPSAFNHYFFNAAKELGYASNADFNGDVQEGVGYYQVTQENGVRCNAARAYLNDAEQRPNLHIIKTALVERITFEQINGKPRATGVVYQLDGAPNSLSAQREVILSAGAFGSPQLLMLSGIGPASHLQALNIPVIADREQVGGNLQDHIDCLLTRHYNDLRLVGPSFGMITKLWSVWQDYKQNKKGRFTTNYSESGGFIKTNPALTKPDVQWHFVIAKSDSHGRNKHWGQGYALHACTLRPYSRGTVRLASNKAQDAPLIDPQYFSDPRDMSAMIQAYKASLAVMQASAFSEVRGRPLFPEAPINDDKAIETFLRNHSDTIYHPVGTCRMGADEHSVVDLDLRVRGVEGLRVVDASIMPTLIGGNTNAPTMMIAEKAADLIRQQAGRN